MMTIVYGTVKLAASRILRELVLVLEHLKHRNTQTFEEEVRKGHKMDIMA